MKKKYVKELRRIAAELPVTESKNLLPCVHMTGGAVLAKGITKTSDGDVDRNKVYKKDTGGNAPVNHLAKMKEFIRRKDLKGMDEYVKSVTVK